MKKPRKPRSKPHAKKKAAAQDLAAMTLDGEWAAGIRATLLADCHPYQLDAVLDEALRITLLVGRGGGKTTALRVRALLKMISIPRARIAYIATSRPQAEKLNWEPLKQLIYQLHLGEEFEFHETKMTCRCKRTGATYEFFGADDKAEVDKLRGQPFNEVQVDEAASHNNALLEMLLDRAVGPRLGERRGCIVLAGSPGHILRGRFYEKSKPGMRNPDGTPAHRPWRERNEPEFAGWKGWSSHAWNMVDILALPDAAKYEALLLNWQAALEEKERQCWTDDNPVWRREYLGIWAADDTTNMYAYRAHVTEGGDPWNQWKPWGDRKLEGLVAVRAALEALVKRRPDIKPASWLYGYGADLGSRDPFALNVVAFSPDDPRREFWHVFSFEKRKMYARTIAELLIGADAVAVILRGGTPDEFGGLFGCTGWPVAFVADLAGLGETLIDELANVYGIKIKAAEKKGKFGAIELVNGDLIDGRMHILADTPLEQQLTELQWKPDEYGQPKEDKAVANHSADSWTYIRTELGTMFAASEPPPREPGDDGPASPRSPPATRTPEARPKPVPPRDDWGDGPVRSRSAASYDRLLDDRDYSGLNSDGKSSDRGWGND